MKLSYFLPLPLLFHDSIYYFVLPNVYLHICNIITSSLISYLNPMFCPLAIKEEICVFILLGAFFPRPLPVDVRYHSTRSRSSPRASSSCRNQDPHLVKVLETNRVNALVSPQSFGCSFSFPSSSSRRDHRTSIPRVLRD